MTPEQEIQSRIASQLGNLFIQITSLQVQLEARDTMIKQMQEAKTKKPQEAAEKK